MFGVRVHATGENATNTKRITHHAGDQPASLQPSHVHATGEDATNTKRITHHAGDQPASLQPSHNYLTTGRYSLNLVGEDAMFSCWDSIEGRKMIYRAYSNEKFMQLAPILFSDLEGMPPIQEILKVGKKTYLIYPNTHGDLHAHLKLCKRLPEPAAAAYFIQVIQILRCAHSRGIVLRDLKLKKFVFADLERKMLKLTDVDDAITMSSNGLLEDRHGCPAYVAPELLQPGAYLGVPADMWSAGVILYTLLVGHYPFFDTNPQLLFARIRSGDYRTPDHVSPGPRSLISSLICYDPLQRPSAEAVLAHPWLVHPSLQQESLPARIAELDQIVPNLC